MAQNDILSEVFAALRLHSGLYFRAELAGAWAVEVPPERRRIRFHLVRHGACWVTVAGRKTATRLEEGDLAIIPNGAVQILADRPDRKAVPLADILAAGLLSDGVLRAGEGGNEVRLLCGFCDFDEAVEHPALSGLPPLIVLSPREPENVPGTAEILGLMARETDASAPGRDGVLSRLLEVAFILVVRHLASGAEGEDGYLSALADPRLSKALSAIHGTPEHPWTLSELARVAGLSRAVFAERFARTIGLPPIGYLTRWRLMKARRLLRETTLGTDEIGLRCGYRSLPSFSRRFKAAFGVGPGAFRRSPGE